VEHLADMMIPDEGGGVHFRDGNKEEGEVEMEEGFDIAEEVDEAFQGDEAYFEEGDAEVMDEDHEAQEHVVEAISGIVRGGDGDLDGDKWYIGTLKSFSDRKGNGTISCLDAREEFGRDVYIHKTVYGTIAPPLGARIKFRIHVNKVGVPQASPPISLVDDGGNATTEQVAQKIQRPRTPRAPRTAPPAALLQAEAAGVRRPSAPSTTSTAPAPLGARFGVARAPMAKQPKEVQAAARAPAATPRGQDKGGHDEGDESISSLPLGSTLRLLQKKPIGAR